MVFSCICGSKTRTRAKPRKEMKRKQNKRNDTVYSCVCGEQSQAKKTNTFPAAHRSLLRNIDTGYDNKLQIQTQSQVYKYKYRANKLQLQIQSKVYIQVQGHGGESQAIMEGNVICSSPLHSSLVCLKTMYMESHGDTSLFLFSRFCSSLWIFMFPLLGKFPDRRGVGEGEGWGGEGGGEGGGGNE